MFLYLTADKIGMASGGGSVTFQESDALKSLGACVAIGGASHVDADPFKQDELILAKVKELHGTAPPFTLAHCYAGCLTKTIRFLQSTGCKIAYTAAAHDVQASRREHERMTCPFPYPHLNNPDLWAEYVEGYLLADVLVVPSQLSKRTMEKYGRKGRIEVIPHGVHIPKEPIAPFPSEFTVGYMGSFGPDKGVRYLLEAWQRLGWKDARLLFAGNDCTSAFAQNMIRHFRGGNVQCMGWVKDVADFYNRIAVYVQPSASEGFGMEVVEAMAHGRPVLCSDGAGACDLVLQDCGFVSPAGNVDTLQNLLQWCKDEPEKIARMGSCGRDLADSFTWDKVRERYLSLWRSMA